MTEAQVYKSIVGQAPYPSCTGTLLTLLLNAFVPGSTIDGILGGANDTIVEASSQDTGAADTASIDGIVHTSLCGGSDQGETTSEAVWTQSATWLMAGLGLASARSSNPTAMRTMAAPGIHALNGTTGGTFPVLDLTGYTQVSSSNVSFPRPRILR